jgi:4-diphosphocytidyl-2-C-methyl-D-erythritol kinase
MAEIDMTATAIATQKLDSVDRPGWIKVVAPAKVNLYLNIGERRDDGYHQAESIFHALNLHDAVYVRTEFAAPGSGLRLTVTLEGRAGLEVPQIEQEQNVAYKAVLALAKLVGRNQDEALTVRIVKNIPAQAGLAGGSADAAAALVGVAKLWGIDPAGAQVEAAAQQLGSDVAFFLRGGCGCYTGKNDVFVRALTPSKASVVLVMPGGGVSTPEAYREFDKAPTAVSEEAVAAAESASSASEIKLANNLAPASERLKPELVEVREWLASQDGVSGADDVLLCGSGSCTFAVCESFAKASAIVAQAQMRGWWARATSFSSIRAAVIS